MSVIYKAIRAIEAEDGRSAPRVGQAELVVAEGRRVSGAGIGLILTAIVVGLSAVVVLSATHFSDRRPIDQDSRLIASPDEPRSTVVDETDPVDQVQAQRVVRQITIGDVRNVSPNPGSTNELPVAARDQAEPRHAGTDHRTRLAPNTVNKGLVGSTGGVRYSFRPAQSPVVAPPAISGGLPASVIVVKSVTSESISGTGAAVAGPSRKAVLAPKPDMDKPVGVVDPVLLARRSPERLDSALGLSVQSGAAIATQPPAISPTEIGTSSIGGILYEDAQDDAPQIIPRVSVTRSGDAHRVQYLNLRLSEALRVRSHDEVATILKQLQNIVGSDSAFMLKTRAYTQLALDGNIPHAMQLLREALARDPHDTEASINMAVAEIKIGEPQLARKRLKGLALLYPDDSRIVSLLKTLK